MDFFKNIDISKLLDSDYVFEKTPPNDSLYIYLGIIFGAFIVFAVSSWYFLDKKIKKMPLFHKFRGRLFNLFLYTGILGLFLIFCRYEGISYLGSRFFMLLLFWMFIIWFVYVINYRFRVLPREFSAYYRQKNFEKYLPSSPKNRLRGQTGQKSS